MKHQTKDSNDYQTAMEYLRIILDAGNERLGLKGNEALIMHALIARWPNTRMSYDELAQSACVSRVTAIRAVKSLQTKGMISVRASKTEEGTHAPNEYTPILPPGLAIIRDQDGNYVGLTPQYDE